MPLIQVKNLSWQIADKQILNALNFTVNKGEVIGIIGPNGAGKTSLLRCLLNQQKNVTGTVSFKNKTIEHYSNKALAQSFAMVAQKASPIFSLTVFDVIRMGLLPHKSLFSLDTDHDLRQISLALEKVGLLDKMHQTYNVLSGGEQQRVLIARALVQKAEVLILDEPTNHLDVYYQHQILQLISQLNITVIMTVHDLNLAAQYCQRLILLNKGELVADDTPENVLTTKTISEVFRLNCQLEQDPITHKPRIYFHLNTKQNHGADIDTGEAKNV